MIFNRPFTIFRRKRTEKIILAICLAILGFAVFLVVLAHHAGPLLRARVVQTLTARFHTQVDLMSLNISVYQGVIVSGKQLSIYGKADPNIHAPGVQPLIGVDQFSFQVGVLDLLHSPMHVGTVFIKGLQLNIPPKRNGGREKPLGSGTGKISIVVDQFHAENADLIINTDKPGKEPLEFAIRNLWMKDIGAGRPLTFTAALINPKPQGFIDSKGEFGPLDSDEPRETPVRGEYQFTHADLGTIAGIGGILSSTGKYHGRLDHISVEGQTDTPDFRLDVSNSPVPLKTNFHAVVDGTNGNTYLQPVNATLLNTNIVAQGSVVRSKVPHGHHIKLDVSIANGHIDDLLRLAVRTRPPVMAGNLHLKTELDIPAGTEDISKRLHLNGKFQVTGAHFSNDKIQSKIDDLSMRSKGKPKLATDNVPDNVKTRMSGNFVLRDSMITSPNIVFQMPGTRVNLGGSYSMDGNKFDFRGHARFDAKLSQMVGGWKSIFLKPVDPFFSKNGAGTVLPIRIDGTKSEPHFGLDFGGGANKSQEADAH